MLWGIWGHNVPMPQRTHANPELVKAHVTFDKDVHEALTAVAKVNDAKGKKLNTFSAIMSDLGRKLLQKPESIAALRAIGHPLADHFATK